MLRAKYVWVVLPGFEIQEKVRIGWPFPFLITLGSKGNNNSLQKRRQ